MQMPHLKSCYSYSLRESSKLAWTLTNLPDYWLREEKILEETNKDYPPFSVGDLSNEEVDEEENEEELDKLFRQP